MLKLQSRVGDWELIKPGRELVKEGELHKISRKGIGSRYVLFIKLIMNMKIFVNVFLFNIINKILSLVTCFPNILKYR